ncbi:hypothetical protein F0562_001996 [Nyssa sinensis]|uniref:SWIRM domain-containing protein n=1 Tax=Nyssa sinensis TaxID=561372 RepID=A0A5J5C8J6_9ASTE|nr:hypothetical protein F0562_001996 [Nyssa sinensis]
MSAIGDKGIHFGEKSYRISTIAELGPHIDNGVVPLEETFLKRNGHKVASPRDPETSHRKHTQTAGILPKRPPHPPPLQTFRPPIPKKLLQSSVPDHRNQLQLTPTSSTFLAIPDGFRGTIFIILKVRFLPEFFDGRSPAKNPRVYKYYRNSIIGRFRENPTRKISFTEARKTIIGDVGSVRRVFDFLEAWGLINYSGSASKQQLKWEDKESKSNSVSSQTGEPPGNSAAFTVPKKRVCSGCKSVCSIACFACDKYELTLCARCYVRGNYRVGVNSSDFKRVEINEEIKADWTDKETLHLLEAIMHYGDNWKKVAEYVGGRSERECVARFIKLPFGEQFVGHPDSAEVDNKFYQTKDQSNVEFGLQSFDTSSPSKRMRLTPLSDVSNPIMAQVKTSIFG